MAGEDRRMLVVQHTGAATYTHKNIQEDAFKSTSYVEYSDSQNVKKCFACTTIYDYLVRNCCNGKKLWIYNTCVRSESAAVEPVVAKERNAYEKLCFFLVL